jgi:hypothetical protein
MADVSAARNSPSEIARSGALLERFNRNVEMCGVHDTVALELPDAVVALIRL